MSASPVALTESQGDRRLGSSATVAAALVGLTLVVRLIPAWLLDVEVADILTYRSMAGAVLRGDNIYATAVLFPYTPFSMYLPAWELLFAQATGLPFDFVAKLPPILADAICTLLIFHLLQVESVAFGPRVAWTALWALNPVGILISAFHGNVMSVIPMLTLAAYVAAIHATADEDRPLLLAISALLLGFAVAMRSFPVLLVPPFLLLFCRTLREAVWYAALASLPSLLSSIPYLIFVRETFLREALGYRGSVDFGWVSVIRALQYFIDGQLLGVFATHLVDMTKGLFLGAYAILLLVLPFFRPDALGRALLVPALLFYAIYGGVSGQYLVWVVPIAIAIRERLVIPFTVISAVALVAFYAMYHPGILAGRHPSPIVRSATVNAWYVAGNVGIVLLASVWSARIVVQEILARRRAGQASTEPWICRLGLFRWSAAYAGVLVVAGGAWLLQAIRTGSEAQALVRAVLRW